MPLLRQRHCVFLESSRRSFGLMPVQVPSRGQVGARSVARTNEGVRSGEFGMVMQN